MIKLSICIPTFNRRDRIAEILDKLFLMITAAGLYKSVEILVGDNASTDDTQAYCLSLKNDLVIYRYIRNLENLGIEKNWMNLAHHSNGDYIWLLSDDDSFSSDILTEIIKLIDISVPDVINLNYTFFDGLHEGKFYDVACDYPADVSGIGSKHFFTITKFSSKFFSSNIFKRDKVEWALPSLKKYYGTPWLHLYLADRVIGESGKFNFVSNPLLRMRALSLLESRREKSISGYSHFYFNAHVEFLKFLENIDWWDKEISKKMSIEFVFQATIEKVTWHANTGQEDYRYWVTMVNSLLKMPHIRSSLHFWFRDIFIMLMPSLFSSAYIFTKTKRTNFGIYIRACAAKEDLLSIALFRVFKFYKNHINKTRF